MMNDLVPTVWVSYYHNQICYLLLCLCNFDVLLKAQMFVMLPVMFVGHLLGPMIQPFCFPMSLMLLGTMHVAMVTSVVIQCTCYSALLATALFDRETNCRKAASVSKTVCSVYTMYSRRLPFKKMLEDRYIPM